MICAVQGLQPGATACCYPLASPGVNSSPPKDADALKGEVQFSHTSQQVLVGAVL